MARKSKSVAKHKIPEIAASLKAKAAMPMTLALEDTISQLAAPIQAMLDAGYAYADVASVFREHGVDLAASSIQSYHRKQIKSEAQVGTSAQPSSAGETSPAVAVDERTERAQVSVPSSEDNTSARDSDKAQSDASGDEPESTPVGAESSPPKQNAMAAKNLPSQPTQAKSQFNVTDRSKL